jgi:hypothetical protein
MGVQNIYSGFTATTPITIYKSINIKHEIYTKTLPEPRTLIQNINPLRSDDLDCVISPSVEMNFCGFYIGEEIEK